MDALEAAVGGMSGEQFAQQLQLFQAMGEEERALVVGAAMQMIAQMPEEQLQRMQAAENAKKEQRQRMQAAENAKKDKAKPAKFCSSCGKESDTLKKCTACKCVWYCDKDCQKNHRREHKEECRRVKTELDKRGGKLDIGTESDLGLPPPDSSSPSSGLVCESSFYEKKLL